MANRILDIIETFGLRPHPEGGHYSRIYESRATLGPSLSGPPRSLMSHIYYLLTAQEHSLWHRLDADEVWNHYEGDGVEISMIDAQGVSSTVVVGNDYRENQKPCWIVPGGTWFSAKLHRTKQKSVGFSFCGCSVTPAFLFEHFELVRDPEKLIELYPNLEAFILGAYL